MAGQDVAGVGRSLDQHLQPLHGGVNPPRRAGGGDFLAQHRPRLDGAAKFDPDPADFDFADPGEAELEERVEPAPREGVAVAAKIVEHRADVGVHVPRQQEAIVQPGAPTGQRPGVRVLPEAGHQRPHQQGLDQRHAGVGWHLESPELDQPEPAPLAVGIEQLVDAELGPVGVAGDVHQQVPQEAVDQPGPDPLAQALQLGEGDLELVQGFVAGLVDARRLAGRPDETAGEQVGQRRMVLPVGQQAPQQVGAAKNGTVGRRRPADGDVVAAPGSGVGSVQPELLSAQPGRPGVLVEAGDRGDQLGPGG